MQLLITSLFVALLLFLTSTTMAQQSKLLTFEDYRVTQKFNGNPAAAVIATRRARMFRTMIRTQAKQGPNFAGHYTVAIWGCGSGCRQFCGRGCTEWQGLLSSASRKRGNATLRR